MQQNKKPLAYIIIGFIGSGKTTFARKLEKETGAIRFTKDEWMVRVFGNTPPKDKFEEYENRMASLATDMALKCLKAGCDDYVSKPIEITDLFYKINRIFTNKPQAK